MRRFDKLKHIQKLNKRLNESLRPEDIPSPSQEEVDQQIAQFKGGEEEEINELSSDKIMGAAKKMWQDKIGGDQIENPRAQKLLNTYAQKLHGMDLFGGVVHHTDVDIIQVNSAFQLIIYIGTKGGGIKPNSHDVGFSGIFYNYSTDQYMLGSDMSSVRPLNEFQHLKLDRYDARQLYKIATHFNPQTRYKNFTREFNIQVEEGKIEEYEEDRNDYDYDHRDGYYAEFTNEGIKRLSEAFEKLCGVKLINEDKQNDTYFETLAGAIEAVEKMAEKMGYTLDDEAVWNEFGTGGVPYETNRDGTIPLLKDGKPIVGKSGKPLNRAIHVSLYRMPSGKYELTAYKTW